MLFRTSTKISKYFNPILNADISVESPYKDLLTSKDDFKPIEINDDGDDFKTPKPVRVAKVFEISKQNKTRKCTKQSKPKVKNSSKEGNKCLHKNNITKWFARSEENSHSVNTEHLHMAIALSKSEVQNSDNEDVSNSDLTPSISSQEKRSRFKAALEQFGFNMNINTKTCRIRNSVEEGNKRKKSKCKYATPVLCTRTEEERLELITNNIALVINSTSLIVKPIEYSTFQLSTTGLKVMHAEDAIIFKKNGSCLNNEKYLVTLLNVPHSDYIPGCLLKNWADILGRDKSPDRQVANSFERTDNTQKAHNSQETVANNSTEEHLATTKSSLKSASTYDKTNNEENEISNKSETAQQIGFVSCDSSHTENIKSSKIADRSETVFSNIPQMLSPDLFSSDDDDTPPHEAPLRDAKASFSQNESEISISINQVDHLEDKSLNNSYFNSSLKRKKDKNTSLTEDDSVINITISQIDRLKQISVDTDFNSMHLEKLERILGENIYKQEKGSSINAKEQYESNNFSDDCDFKSYNYSNDKLQTKNSCEEDKLVDLTNNCDSDCYIVESPEEIASTSKTSLKRFSSFNSTTSVDSYSSRTSQISIEISDEELNYSTINSTSCKKQKSKRMSKTDCVASSFINLSSAFKGLTNEIKDTSDMEGYNNEMDMVEYKSLKHNESSNYSNILESLDDIISKYAKEIQGIDNLSVLNNSSLLNDANSEEDNKRQKSQSPPELYDTNNSKFMNLNSPSLLNECNHTQRFQTCTENDLTPTVTKSPIGTPINDNLFIKTDNVTPLPNYLDMDTPKIVGELRKFGLKPLKRKRGVQLLQYLYDVTHPEVSDAKLVESEGEESKAKKRKAVKKIEIDNSFSAVTIPSVRIEIVGDIISESESINDLVLEHKKSVKVSTCAVPLNISWHNLLATNSSIRESMLMYEPLEVERLYAMLKAQGLKYNVQDLITFLDSKCITIRTKQNTGKRK